MTAFQPPMSDCKLQTAMSQSLLTFMQMFVYLIDLTALQYSTFMFALYVIDSKGEYRTTHRLSTSMPPFRICMVAN